MPQTRLASRRAPDRAKLALLAGAVLAIALAIAIATAVFGNVFWTQAAARLDAVRIWASLHPGPAVLGYLLVFTAMTLACLPVGPASAVAGGVLFGAVLGAAAAIAAAVAGGALLFLLARRLMAQRWPGRHAALLARLRRDGFLAVLALRLAPVTPGWLISVAAGGAGLRLATFVLASAIGILPAFALFARLGAGVGEQLRRGEAPTVSLLLQPQEVLPLGALAALIGVPILLRAWRARPARLARLG